MVIIMLSTTKYWVWLSSAAEPAAAWLVYDHFGSPEDAFLADESSYDLIRGLPASQRASLRAKDLSLAEEILDNCVRHNIRVLTWQDAGYPERLRNTYQPPMVLYLKGRTCHFDEEAAIAMAGTRKATLYGKQMAFSIAQEITLMGGLVVTGIVTGCDYHSAVGALTAGGPLVCVTAGGVDVPYYDSRSGRRFLEDIAAAGTLISLNPPGTHHLGSYFARRNQLLVGLTLGVVCVEAAARSGTLQVARMAADQSRDVFTVPANVGIPSSAGTNHLLRQGAIPILHGSHVLEEYEHLFPFKGLRQAEEQGAGNRRPPAVSPAPAVRRDVPPERTKKKIDTAGSPDYIDLDAQRSQFSDDELVLLQALRQGPLSAEELIEQSKLPASRAVAAVTLLVLRGFAVELPGNRFQLSDQPGPQS